MAILNKKVLHKNYGAGIIDSYANNNFHVKYQNGKQAMYDYPEDLGHDGIVKLLDADEETLIEINNAIKIKNGDLLVNIINGIQKLGLPDRKTIKPTSINPSKISKLNHGDCFDVKAKDVYSALCKNDDFNWDLSCAGKFGSQQHLFAQNATPEGYSVWFIPYSSYTSKMSETRGIYNNILEDSKDIDEYWINDTVFDCANYVGEKIVTFVKNKFEQYEFWGVMEIAKINEVEKIVNQKYISDTYVANK